MASTSASPQSWLRPADAVRQVLNSLFGRQSAQAPGSGLPDPPHRTAGLVPEMPEALTWMESQITALADRGKLDEHHGDILEPAVSTLVKLWTRRLDEEHSARLSRLKQAELDLEAQVCWLQRKADSAAARITALDSALTMRSAQPEEPDEPEEAT